ncbi:MAG: substrate-binding domain-containing protein [Armatimonadota bacterium]
MKSPRFAVRCAALAAACFAFAGCTVTTPGAAPPPANAPAASGGEETVVVPEAPPVPEEVVPSGKPDRPLTVGVSLLTRTHEFYKEMEAAMREAAEEHGITLQVQSADMDRSRQLEQVQTFLSQKVDAIILCPVDSQSSGSLVQLANEQRVPVFTADIASKGGDVVCHVASNNEQGGELVGDYLAEALGGTGEVAIIDYPVVTSVQDRVRGFKKAIARHPGIKIVAQPAPEKPERAVTFPVAQDLLQSRGPSLKGVFGINDDCALAVVQAASAAGRDDLVVVGFDATPEAQQYIRQGSVLKADAMQFPGVIGRSVVSAVVKNAAGEAVPKTVAIPTGLLRRK